MRSSSMSSCPSTTPCRPMTTQYQSAVWPQNDAQREAVLAAIDRYEAARGRTVTTRVLDSDAVLVSRVVPPAV